MELNKLLHKLTELQTEISALGKLPKEVLQKINYKFRLDWNYYSNRMEGGTLTKAETRSVMVGNITVDGKPIKDVMEMNGHDEIIREVLRMGAGAVRISEKRIKGIHSAIINASEDSDKNKQIGVWKTIPNEIINYKGEKISFTAPADVATEIHDLINQTNAELDAYFNRKKQAKHPLIIAADFHLGFVSIHPFFDGNGRTARILMNLILVACGYPPIVITDTDKKAYYQYLADIQAYGGDKDLMYYSMAELLKRSLLLVLKASRGEEIEEEDDLDKRLEMLKRSSDNDQDNKIQLHKKDIDIVNFIFEVLNPLTQAIYKQFVKLESLFAENLINVQLDQVSMKHPSQAEISATIRGVFAKASIYNQFHFLLDHLQYKKAGLDAFNVYWSITLKFEDSKYLVSCKIDTKEQVMAKLYHQQLSEAEIKTLANSYFKYVLDQIESNLEKIKNGK